MLSEEEIINKIYKLRNVLTILNDYGKEDVEAIDGLLDLYNKDKEKIQKYEKQLDLDYVDENFISKDKLKEKIEKYNKIRTETPNSIIYTRMVDYINCLEELLSKED